MTATEIEYRKLVDEALNLKGSISKAFNRFYAYSYMNQLLLWCQGVEEPVATYRRWQEMGRQVKKGSKAKMVVRPVPVYEENEKGEKEQKFVTYRPTNTVFALSDTEGEELPPAPKVEAWNPDLALTTLEIFKKNFDMLNGNVQGYATGRELAINPVAVFPLETMAHELAHIVLGHTDKTMADGANTERDIKEFQAEMVSFIVMNEIEAVDGKDWNRKEARGYIQHWLQDKKPEEKDIKPIFTAADKIIKAGRTPIELNK